MYGDNYCFVFPFVFEKFKLLIYFSGIKSGAPPQYIVNGIESPDHIIRVNGGNYSDPGQVYQISNGYTTKPTYVIADHHPHHARETYSMVPRGYHEIPRHNINHISYSEPGYWDPRYVHHHTHHPQHKQAESRPYFVSEHEDGYIPTPRQVVYVEH